MKRKNFIYKLNKSTDADNYIKILQEENNDPDIWLGLRERKGVIEEYVKKREGNLRNSEYTKDSEYNSIRIESGHISNIISRIIVPAVATVVISSFGLLPELEGLDALNGLNAINILSSQQENITSDSNKNEPTDIVLNCRIIDNTQTMEIENFAFTRTDNNVKVESNKIGPGTSGEFIIEIDATRNRNCTKL